MLVMRSARSADKDAFIDLARSAGPGFTSLAVGDDELSERLYNSEQAFDGKLTDRALCNYQLMLEDTEARKVVGTSAVKAEIGIKKPYFDLKIVTVSQSSKPANKRFDMDVMLLVNDFAGASEVGSLFVLDGLRGLGAGRLCSQSRYLLIAADPSRFGDRVLAELRGVSDENGFSPFYEALAKPFFRMGFIEADELSASSDNQFIKDLMPIQPIYVDLLPEAAKAVIGKTHPDGVNALRLLEQDGFRYDRYIDIFDGGPLVCAPTRDISTIKNSRLMTVADASITTPKKAIVSTDTHSDFRCVFVDIGVDDTQASLDDATRRALNVCEGETVRVWMKD